MAIFLVGLFMLPFILKAQKAYKTDLIMSSMQCYTPYYSKPSFNLGDSVVKPETKFILGFRFISAITHLKFNNPYIVR